MVIRHGKKYTIRRTFVAVILVIFGWVISNVYNHIVGPSFHCPDIVVTVESGDTVWGILENYCTGDIRDAVYDVDKALGTVTVHPGQQIQLPQG